MKPDSSTETYAALRLEIDNWRWFGVPFYLRSGKKLKARETEIAVAFKHVPASIFKPLMADQISPNILRFRIQPDEGITLCFESKHPGSKLCMSTVTMHFSYQDAFGVKPPEAYTRLFLDVMIGDQTLFARQDWLAASWKLLDPLLDYWAEKKDQGLATYAPGSWGPPEADALLGREKPAMAAELNAPLTIVEKTIPALLAHMARDIQKKITQTLARQEYFTWVLSGGNTPRRLYQLLAQEPYVSSIPWPRLMIFWGDERLVPPTDPDSNFRMANEALLQHVPTPAQHIFRLQGEWPAAQAASEYEAQLKKIFKELPAFDLILLGMGPDGHTASLFPGSPAVQEKNRWALENPLPEKNTTRLTLTLPVINNARAIYFLATGADKAPVYAKARTKPDVHYPASLVAPVHGQVSWYVDSAITKIESL